MIKLFDFLLKIIIYFFSFLIVLIFRIIKPIILIRIGNLWSFRIGHFAANTELYLCEKDAKIKREQGNEASTLKW